MNTAVLKFNVEKGRFEARFKEKLIAHSGSQEHIVRIIRDGLSRKALAANVTDVVIVGDTPDQFDVKQLVGEVKGTIKPSFTIDQRFDFLSQLARMVINKDAVSLIVTGQGGLGKTHTINAELIKAGLISTADNPVMRVSNDYDEEIMETLKKRTKECIAVAAKYYENLNDEDANYEFKMPSLTWDATGRVTAMAYPLQNRIAYNIKLARHNMEHFIEITVPHEVSHLVAEVVHPNAKQMHGPEFREVMNDVFGIADAPTHHTLDVHEANMDAEEFMVSTADYHIIKGYSSARGLYKALFENRTRLIIFDDCDNIFKDDNAVNILKGALDSHERRFVSWNVDMKGADGIPNQFEFLGRIIFISNLRQEKIDQAVKSRSLRVDLSMTHDEIIQRMTTISKSPEFLPEFSDEIKHDALEFLNGNSAVATDLNLRTLSSVVKIRATAGNNWKDLALYTISA